MNRVPRSHNRSSSQTATPSSTRSCGIRTRSSSRSWRRPRCRATTTASACCCRTRAFSTAVAVWAAPAAGVRHGHEDSHPPNFSGPLLSLTDLYLYIVNWQDPDLSYRPCTTCALSVHTDLH